VNDRYSLSYSTYDEKAAIIIALMLVAKSDGVAHPNEYRQIMDTAKFIDIDFDNPILKSLKYKDHEEVFRILKSLDYDKKKWFINAMQRMILVDGQITDSELTYTLEVAEKIGVNEKEYLKTLNETLNIISGQQTKSVMLSKELRCLELIKLGYKEVVNYNNKPYSGKDYFFCPQEPGQYLLCFVKHKSLIEKRGKSGYKAVLSTEVNSIDDIIKLHEEINKVIYKQDESTFKEKFNSGCMLSLIFILGITFLSILI
jgi:uncharacterized tellurite resistance protein B-like protein